MAANRIVRRGAELPWAKLNEKLVRLMRAEREAKDAAIAKLHKEHSAEAMAKRYQVSVNTVHKVLTYETWKHA